MHPWKVSQWHYCVGFGRWLHTSTSGTWYPRLPTLFGEQCLFLYQEYAFIIDIMIIFLCLLVQILWRNRPEIQVFQVSATSFSWCKDREESGVYPGWQGLGNVTNSDPRNERTDLEFSMAVYERGLLWPWEMPTLARKQGLDQGIKITFLAKTRGSLQFRRSHKLLLW